MTNVGRIACTSAINRPETLATFSKALRRKPRATLRAYPPSAKCCGGMAQTKTELPKEWQAILISYSW